MKTLAVNGGRVLDYLLNVLPHIAVNSYDVRVSGHKAAIDKMLRNAHYLGDDYYPAK